MNKMGGHLVPPHLENEEQREAAAKYRALHKTKSLEDLAEILRKKGPLEDDQEERAAQESEAPTPPMPHRAHRATPWRNDLERAAPFSARPTPRSSLRPLKSLKPKPLKGLSIEEGASHKAHLGHHSDTPKNSVTSPRHLIGANTIRHAYLFKELIDKPVGLRD